MLAETGGLIDMIEAGARILECSCGPCIGIGQSPPTDGVSLRTFNRNFRGRSGTLSARLYLCSPEVAAVSAIKGKLTDPRSSGKPPAVAVPRTFPPMEHLFLQPSEHPETVEVVRGPNIKVLPTGRPLPDTLNGEVLISLGDDVTTDDILPAGARIMALRSNIPAISEYVFSQRDPEFAKRAREKGGGFIVGGRNYGQGSSREHAALASMFLGIKGVLALSFARIHRSNLINFGILPMLLSTSEEREGIRPGDELVIEGVATSIKTGKTSVRVGNRTREKSFEVSIDLDDRERKIVLAGGLLNLVRLRS